MWSFLKCHVREEVNKRIDADTLMGWVSWSEVGGVERIQSEVKEKEAASG